MAGLLFAVGRGEVSRSRHVAIDSVGWNRSILRRHLELTKVVSHIFVSWNKMAAWLRRVHSIRHGA
jgi:hypothetical protein